MMGDVCSCEGFRTWYDVRLESVMRFKAPSASRSFADLIFDGQRAPSYRATEAALPDPRGDRILLPIAAVQESRNGTFRRTGEMSACLCEMVRTLARIGIATRPISYGGRNFSFGSMLSFNNEPGRLAVA